MEPKAIDRLLGLFRWDLVLRVLGWRKTSVTVPPVPLRGRVFVAFKSDVDRLHVWDRLHVRQDP